MKSYNLQWPQRVGLDARRSIAVEKKWRIDRGTRTLLSCDLNFEDDLRRIVVLNDPHRAAISDVFFVRSATRVDFMQCFRRKT